MSFRNLYVQFEGDANLVARRRLVLLLVAVLAASGCLQGLDVMPEEGFDLDAVPGMGSVDLSDARAPFELEDCQETHLIADGDPDKLAEAIPEPFTVTQDEKKAGQLIVTIVECAAIHAGNDTFANASYFTVGTPIALPERAADGERSELAPADGSTTRDDALLAAGSPNTTLTAHLGAAGLPVEAVGTIREERSQDYGIAEQTRYAVETLSHSFDAQVTAVSVEAEVPFGVGPAIGRTAWVVDGNETLELRRGLDVTELGGLSATIEPDPADRLDDLAAERSLAAHGVETRFDARMGTVSAGSG